jgi:hypothetical protein
MEKSDLKYQSIIPADRVFVNGKQSKLEAYVNWIITDVNNIKRRGSQIISIKSGSMHTDKDDWTIIRDGHGLVPLKIMFDIQEDSNENKNEDKDSQMSLF